MGPVVPGKVKDPPGTGRLKLLGPGPPRPGQQEGNKNFLFSLFLFITLLLPGPPRPGQQEGNKKE